ncbi:MAG: terminase [Synergistaceae bacterium]|jgi:hypothetical protein|nr:terminase [Synergistaceae bacterium]
MNAIDFDRELAADMGALSKDPLKWVRYAFPWGKGELADYPGPDTWQTDILSYIRDGLSTDRPLRAAVASGHGIGKSALVAWLILWAISTCPDAKGVVTANTGTQLKTKTWAELGKWHNRFIARHWFDLSATSIAAREKGHEPSWRVDSIVWSKNNSEAFAGLHNQGKRIIVVFDEASAIDDIIWEVTEGALTDKGTEILWFAFGNPTRNTGRFRECFRKHRDLWRHVSIDSRTAAMTNKEQLKQWAETYGEESDFVKVRVRGEFPDVSDRQLIGTEAVRAAMERSRELAARDIAGAPKIFGVDVAGTGEDCSAVWMRQGLRAKRLYKKNIKDVLAFGDVVTDLIQRENPDTVFLDMGAMGSPLLDQLRRLGFGHLVQGVYFGGAAIRADLYADKRTEMWHKTALWLKDGGTLPDKAAESQDIEEDLTGPEYFYNDKGKMKLESKDDMKDRGLHSPDDADALALTFAAPVYPRSGHGRVIEY